MTACKTCGKQLRTRDAFGVADTVEVAPVLIDGAFYPRWERDGPVAVFCQEHRRPSQNRPLSDAERQVYQTKLLNEAETVVALAAARAGKGE